jgi:hypothetical protein
MEQQFMRFDEPKAKRLKKAYDEAVAAGKDQFVFEGADFLTSYCKYLLEYLRNEGVLR